MHDETLAAPSRELLLEVVQSGAMPYQSIGAGEADRSQNCSVHCGFEACRRRSLAGASNGIAIEQSYVRE